MQNLAVIEAPNVESEALAIAVAMREAQHDNVTTALVTPDRALARRVLAALDRWNLACNDSGGDSLMDTRAGLFARLIAQAAAEAARAGAAAGAAQASAVPARPACGRLAPRVSDLELALLRGTRPPPGLDGLRRSFDSFRAELAKLKRDEASALHRSERRAACPTTSLDAVDALIADLARALAPLANLDRDKLHALSTLASRHRAVIEQLSTDDDGVVAAFEGRRRGAARRLR